MAQPAAYKLPRDVENAIEQCRSVQHASDAAWTDATELALDWILSLEPTKPSTATQAPQTSSMKGKQAYEPPQTVVHWYCGAHGADSCWLAAVWLVRLLSFKPNDQVAQWRHKHDRLLQTCALCVESFQHAKEQLVTEFLSTLKPEKTLQAFRDGVERIEYTAVRQSLERAGLATASADNGQASSSHVGRPRLELVPIAVLHNCLVNNRLFERDDVASALSSGLPVANAINLPRLPSPGLLAWRLCEDDKLRRWAQLQLSQCDDATEQHYTSANLDRIMQAHLEILANRDRNDETAPTPIGMTYTTSRRAYWEGLAHCLELLLPEVIEKHLERGPNARNDVIELVRAHLSDNGDHVLAVTSCFRHLLVKLGFSFWREGTNAYEVVLLDAVLNNIEFENTLADSSLTSTDDYLAWLDPYLDSVATDKHLFSSSVTIISSELLERLQHLRFPSHARVKAIKVAISLLSDIFLPQATSLSSASDLVSTTTRFPFVQEALKTLDLHAGFLCRTAFGPSSDGEWKEVAGIVRSFLQRIMEQDSKRLREGVYALGRYSSALQEQERRKKAGTKAANGQAPANEEAAPIVVPPPVRISAAVWDRAYATVQDTDVRGISCLLIGAAPSFHLEQLTARTWSIRDQARAQMKAINAGLDTIRTRLEPLVVGLADESPQSLISLMNDSAFEEALVTLMLSPVESIQNMAQAVVKQAFDVATRRECFRCLLFQFPNETFRGLSRGIRAFLYSSRILPESCGMAKRIVRCLSDVIDSLCATTDGLLRDATFVMRASEGSSLSSTIMSLWKNMCRSLASLFKRTPTWASFFENEQMTEWMRDAILFGVDLVDQIRTFDLAISGQTGALTGSTSSSQQLKSPQKASNATRRMLVLLNEPLEELTHWLRLNDEDLLNSSFNLLTAMLTKFNKFQVPLMQTTCVRLDKITNTDKPREQRSNNLRDDQLMELARALNLNRAGANVIEVSSDEDERPTKSKASSSSSSSLVQQKLQASKGFPFGTSSNNATPSASSKGPNFKVSTMKNVARPRGVPWTNYSSKQHQRRSSDSSSSSDEDDEGQGDRKVSGLASLANAQKPARIKQVEKRSVKRIDVDDRGRAGRPGAAVNGGKSRTEAQQAARVARLRGPADLTRLHRIVLQWDIRRDDDELPPSFDSKGPIRSIGSTFKTPDDYYNAFEPLLLAECWEQIRVAKTDADKEGQVLTCQIAGRQSVDDFTDVFMTIDHGQLPDKIWFNESDLVWLRQGQKSTLGKVQSSSFKREFTEVTVRCHLGSDVTDVSAGLVGRTKWEIVKLCSLSTVHREYAALQTIGDLDLFDDVANPRPQPRIQVDSKTIKRTMDNYNVNEPQAVAINNALRTRGFSLIQGPPGTGKTKTILGLVGAFVDSRPRAAAPIVPGRPTDPASVEPVAKVLLCAPSNAAVDEVAKRLKDGVRTSDGRHFVPKVVRIGADAAVDIAVKDIFIDELVAREIGGDAAATSNTGDSQAKMQSLRAEVDSLRAARDAKIDEISKVENIHALRSQLVGELKETKAKIFNLSQQLDQEKDKAQQSKRAMDALQRKVRMQILSNADVICATLSGSGHDYMAQLPFDFETVIIDEAAQSVELSSLIPLKYGCKRCIMVGDPLQLPPTVISSAAKRAGYERSLFVRLMDSGRGSHLLSIQYRMHPNISAFPSAAFYDSRLKDGPDMAKITAQPWHDNSLFPPYAFYHVADGKEVSGRHHSWSNPREAATALALYERLLRDYPSIDFDYRIGVVTPYKGQVAELKRTFRRRFGDSITSQISFNTVDGFQGQEKDIIILSCVRGGSADSGVGFLKDTRRMNVALTRARSSLFVLGDSQKLRQNKYWSNLITDAESRGLLSNVTASTFASLAVARPPTVKAAVSKSKVKPIEVAPTFIAASDEQANNDTRGVKRPALEATSSSKSDVKRRIAESIAFSAPNGKQSSVSNGVPSTNRPSDPAPEVKMEDVEQIRDEKPKKPPIAAVARPRPKASMFMPSKKRPGAPGR
ncbi:hypothetical protein ACM66B_003346 [Microbotryomycetes sp. NB124-2]